MKKVIVSILLAVLTIGTAAAAAAAPSISQIIPESPTVISGNLGAGEELVVQNADTSAYTNQTVVKVVEKVNDENTKTTIKEVLQDLNVNTKTTVRTESNKTVNPTLYETVTPFVDLVIKAADQIKYESTGSIKATITIEPAKDMKRQDALLMQIDPTTGKVYFVEIEKLNRSTGEVTATFPTLGPVALCEKVPIVVKDVSPENYEDQKVAEVVEKFRDEKADMNLLDILTELKDTAAEEIEKEIQITPDKTINIEDYNSCMGFADMAIKQGEDEYLYDMDGELEAEAHRDIQDTDWERIVAAQYPDFDIEAAAEDLGLLTDLDSFVLEDSFVMQMNPVSGEVDYIANPEISFAYPEEEASGDEEAEEEEASDDADEDELMGWEIHDEDKDDENEPNLVINAKFTSMGPFAIFMQKAE